MKCSHCGREFQGGFCPYCGAPAPEQDGTPVPPAPPYSQPASSYHPPSQPYPQAPYPPKKGRWKGWPALLIVLIVLFVIGGLVSLFDRAKEGELTSAPAYSRAPAAPSEPGDEPSGGPSTAPSSRPTAAVGQTVTDETWAISLTGAKVYDRIEDKYLPMEPEEGKQYLILFFDVQNISAEDEYFNYFKFESYVDGYSSQISLLLGEVDGYDALTGNVAAGKKRKGYLAWEVDPGWQELEVAYKENSWTGEKTDAFVVTPDQLTG